MFQFFLIMAPIVGYLEYLGAALLDFMFAPFGFVAGLLTASFV